MSGKRVVLIKPGDTLLIGNLGTLAEPEQTREILADLKAALGIDSVAVFEADIDIDALSEVDQ